MRQLPQQPDREFHVKPAQLILRIGTLVETIPEDDHDGPLRGTVVGHAFVHQAAELTCQHIIELDPDSQLTDRGVCISLLVAHPDNIVPIPT